MTVECFFYGPGDAIVSVSCSSVVAFHILLSCAMHVASLSIICRSSHPSLIIRAHSFPRQNLTNSAANLVNSAAHRGKANEIPRLTAVTQLNFRGLIKSTGQIHVMNL